MRYHENFLRPSGTENLPWPMHTVMGIIFDHKKRNSAPASLEFELSVFELAGLFWECIIYSLNIVVKKLGQASEAFPRPHKESPGQNVLSPVSPGITLGNGKERSQRYWALKAFHSLAAQDPLFPYKFHSSWLRLSFLGRIQKWIWISNPMDSSLPKKPQDPKNDHLPWHRLVLELLAMRKKEEKNNKGIHAAKTRRKAT